MKNKICSAFLLAALWFPVHAQMTLPGEEPSPVAATADTPSATADAASPAPVAGPDGIYKIRRGYAEVICAEISLKKRPEMLDPNPLDYSPFDNKTSWAQIIMMLPAGRGLSRFDFVLMYGAERCPCMAVVSGDLPYSMKKDAWELPKDRDAAVPVRLLFAIPSVGANNELLEMKLVRAFSEPKSSLPDDVIVFRVMPDDVPLTTAESAQKYAKEKGGSCGMTYKQLTAPPPAAAPAAPAAPAAGETPAAGAAPEAAK